MKKIVIDLHVHPAFLEPVCKTEYQNEFAKKMYGLYKTDQIPVDALLTLMDCSGVDKAVLLPLDLTTEYGGILGTNDRIKELTATYPDRFIGFASVDPHRPDATEILETAFAEYHLAGLKLHPSKQKFYPGDEYMEPIYQICEKYNKPIVFHCGMSVEPDTLSKYARPVEFEETAYRHPKLRICLAHCGWPWVQETCMLMLKYRNVYADTAFLYFDTAPEFYHKVFEVDMGPHWIDRSFRHQIMFGSDDPRLEMRRMKKAIEAMDIRESTKDLIFGQNAIEFLGLEV